MARRRSFWGVFFSWDITRLETSLLGMGIGMIGVDGMIFVIFF